MTLRPILQSDPKEAEWLLLHSAELDAPPSDGKARLLTALGVGAGAATATTAGAAAAASKGVLSSFGTAIVAAKWLGIGALGGVVVAGAAQLASSGPSDESAADARPVPVSANTEAPRAAPTPFTGPPATITPAASEAKATPPAAETAGAVTLQRAPASARELLPAPPPGPSIGKFPEGKLADEIALLDAARSALGAGDPTRCLSMLQTHGERFTAPRLSPEVRVLRIEALVALGKWEEARRLGREFLASHPESTHGQRVRTLLGGDSASR
jgi:hypothetical protein